MIKYRNLLGIFVLVLIGFNGVASAQELEQGSMEALAFLGGVSKNFGTTFGVGVARAIRPRLLVVGEYGHIPIGDLDSDVLGSSGISASAFEIGVNAHYLFPLSTNAKVTPYVLGGLGFFRFKVEASDVTILGESLGDLGKSTDKHVGLNIGGGVRWQVGENWGVRPELKFFISTDTLTRGSIGVYYQFGK